MMTKDQIEWVGIVCWPLLVCALLVLIGLNMHHMTNALDAHRAYIQDRDLRWEVMQKRAAQDFISLEEGQRAVLKLLKRGDAHFDSEEKTWKSGQTGDRK